MKPKPALLPRVSRAMVEPGDVVVVETPGALSTQEHAVLQLRLKNLWPSNRALVLQNGMRLQIGIAAPPPRRRRRAS